MDNNHIAAIIDIAIEKRRAEIRMYESCIRVQEDDIRDLQLRRDIALKGEYTEVEMRTIYKELAGVIIL